MRRPGLLRRLLDRDHAPARQRGPMGRLPAAERPHLVDAHTRTFWSRGAIAPATLVEADDAAPELPTRRAATLVADHERGVAGSSRPRANPAFSEAVFVELMRARQYRRAYALLSPECQQSWGSLQAFIDAQRIGALVQLRGVRVTEVRQLDNWRDPDSGMVHEHAAELDVLYEMGDGTRSASVPRTVHLVAFQGGWRSLCYPTAGAGR
ncbi:MAG: hypothetical protein JF886_06700 [Candidatus Dormibacteraeota bacterium]|uniref:Uncharacterized protein n=1 Tax=Candidatus Aeolococcus gillhamiae TaxID=3127015 RepID=A0A2W6A1Q6_9BACT|nr:hypothetical protein [Candidatus Dormibacteraeota bacterium]PZR77614.1 MAG: hypothetical protein DLM65_15345 [Candidatus Dormibacter sp. RRmetagenome_bin12]